MREVVYLLLNCILVLSCEDFSLERKIIEKGININTTGKIQKQEVNIIEKRPFLMNGQDTLVCVNYYNTFIYTELKYATADNFMHRVLYDTLKTVYVQRVVAQRLASAQAQLTAIDSSLHLLVYDGVRPLSVQWEMWYALDTIPEEERGKFVSNPKNGSIHNYGAAVDLTICHSNREVLDMGANYDDIRKIAYPSLEAEFLKSGELKNFQVENRRLLRKVMLSQGFANIPSEWWHFNAYSRPVAKTKFQIVTRELINSY